MSRKRAVKLIASWLILLPACLRQDLTAAFGQPAIPEAKADAPAFKQEPAAMFIEQARSNPFLSLDEERNFFGPKEPPAPIVLDYFNLSAIFYSQTKTGSKAIINGMICEVGDEVDAVNSKKIAEIQPREVMLKGADGLEYLLRLTRGS